MRASLWTSAFVRSVLARDAAAGRVALGANSRHNFIANSTFRIAQRQAPASVTTYSNTSGRSYGPDRWGLTNENASMAFQRVNTATTPETGYQGRFYGGFLKVTSAGKIIVSQALETNDCMTLRGRKVRLQFKGKIGSGSYTLRCCLLQLTSAGSVNQIPATFVSAFGSGSTDPTWGTNLSAITPDTANLNTSISGSGLSCALASGWTLFGGTFTCPSDFRNLVVVIFSDTQIGVGDFFYLGEVGLFDGEEQRPFIPTRFDEDLALCQKYCCKTFATESAPVQNAGTGTGEHRWVATQAGAVVQKSPTWSFPVRMRLAPTVTVYSPNAASAQAYDQDAAQACTATTTNNVTDRGLNVHATGHATTAVGNYIAAHFLCEAEI